MLTGILRNLLIYRRFHPWCGSLSVCASGKRHRRILSCFLPWGTKAALLNKEVFTLTKTDLSQIRALLGTSDETALLLAMHSLCARIRRCEGTPPDYVRNVYSQLGLLLESAAEFHGAAKAQAAGGAFVYMTAQMECLKDLENELLRIAELLYEEIRERDFDPVSQVNGYIQAPLYGKYGYCGRMRTGSEF